MPNPTLTDEHKKQAKELIESVLQRIDDLSRGDRGLKFAYLRTVSRAIKNVHGCSPGKGRKLKKIHLKKQDGKCNVCKEKLPEKYNVLDRFHAIDGYTEANTQLICQDCDRKIQDERKFKAA